MNTITQDIRRIVREACARDSNIFGYGIWTHHITQVVKHGRHMAELCQANPEIVEIAALLHDYAAIKDESLIPLHHIHGAAEAERILTEMGYPADKIEAVKHCIIVHRASVPGEKHSLEAKCLADADAMAHLDQVPAMLYYAFVRRGLSIDEGTAWVKNKLERTWGKLSLQGKEMMRDKYETALTILTVGEYGSN